MTATPIHPHAAMMAHFRGAAVVITAPLRALDDPLPPRGLRGRRSEIGSIVTTGTPPAHHRRTTAAPPPHHRRSTGRVHDRTAPRPSSPKGVR
jgi:hypothetical protein